HRRGTGRHSPPRRPGRCRGHRHAAPPALRASYRGGAAMNEIALLYNFLLVGGILFTLGLVGFVVRRNLIVMFLCAELMLQGVSFSPTGWGRYHGGLGSGLSLSTAGVWGAQMLVIFITTVAACEAGIAMALILMLARRIGKLDSAAWQTIREEGQPVYV